MAISIKPLFRAIKAVIKRYETTILHLLLTRSVLDPDVANKELNAISNKKATNTKAKRDCQSNGNKSPVSIMSNEGTFSSPEVIY